MQRTARGAGHEDSGPPAPSADSIDGAALAAALTAAAGALRDQADAINAINVFPVPDGDTGTNMSLTMRAAVDDLPRGEDATAHEVAKAAARGALMGAKGNSGVILSQILAGFSQMPEGLAAIDTPALADAFERARAAAYNVVSAPKEGTILTAIAAAAAAAAGRADGGDALAALDAVVEATRDAVRRTPELLPVLKEAGVVDSGAQGLYVLLDAMRRSLRGETAAAPHDDLGAIDESWLAATRQMHGDAHAGAQSGYCTEFVISGHAIDTATLRERMHALGDSVLVVGGDDVVRVHVHTQTPDDVLAHARTLGAVSREKVDDMEAQFEALASRAREGEAAPRVIEGVAVVAVAAGSGLQELFASMGASVVHGGQTMNPSAGDIRRAIEGTGASGVIVLPNNKNIVLAAKQAAEGLAQRVRVIETRSVPQGVAALVAHNAEAPFDDDVEVMAEASAGVRTAEITLAARATTLGGLAVEQGQPIGIIDGELAVAERTVDDAARACVTRMLDGRDASLITLYTGEGVDEASVHALAGVLRTAHDIEVETVTGGQPHYPYLIGVE